MEMAVVGVAVEAYRSEYKEHNSVAKKNNKN